RLYPDAFLAASVIVCEGASEVGLLRGLDQARAADGQTSISAVGVALVDCGGGSPDKPFDRAMAFLRLGYRVAVVRDDDQKATDDVVLSSELSNGTLFSWRDGRALEDELFCSLSDEAITEMLDLAIELRGEDLVDQHIRTASAGSLNLDDLRVSMREYY